MTLYAYDGASPFSLTAAKNHGAVLITGYIVGRPGGYDPIDRARVRRIHELGMGFLPNWERGAGYLVTCSRADGVAAGREAVAALRALGVPDDGSVACPFSWDTWVNVSQYAHCGVVADGIIEGLAGRYLFTAYGQGGLIDYLARTGRLQSEGWLSASTSFPGYDAASPRVALVQRVGTPVAGTDQNVLTDPRNVHAWWPAGSPYATKGNPLANLDAEDRKWLLDNIGPAAVWSHEDDIWNGTKPPAWRVLSDAHHNSDTASAKIAAVASVVNTLAPRVAALQVAVAKLAPPAVGAVVDVAEIAAAVTARLAQKLGA